MEISLVFRVHPSEDVLEEYSFGRLNGKHLTAVEEHLLACPACQGAVEENEQYIRLVKAAVSRPPLPRRGALARFRIPARMPTPGRAWAGAGVLAFGLLVGAITLSRNSSEPPAQVALQSYRGTETLHGENHAPALRPLDFRIGTEDIPRAPEYRLEVVTAVGRTVWTGPVSSARGLLQAHLAKRLPGGLYWVRLYGDQAELLSEYGLRLE